MLVSADQLLCHLIGDYVLQSDWMASEKTKRLWPALVHAMVYAVPFMFLIDWHRPNPGYALSVIVITHQVIDHFRLARYVCWVKNLPSPKDYRFPWSECTATGYHKDKPIWLTCWLLFICDNTMHIMINALALKYIP